MGRWIIYIVECSDSSLYTGISNDLTRRLEEHNTGKGAKYTRGRTPVILRWICFAKNRSEASKKECQIKKLSRVNKLKMIENSEEF